MSKVTLGILSDTHIIKNSQSLVPLLRQCFQEVDYIIHAGDFNSKEMIEVLQRNWNFIGVWGNVDTDEVKGFVNEKEILSLNGYKVGVFHGHGTGKTTLDRAYEKFQGDDVDIIIFGHSHQPLVKTKNNVLMLNPGSLTSKRKERWFSYMVVELSSQGINAQVKFLTKNC